MFLKAALEKNQEQENLIHQFQDVVGRLKQELSAVYEEK